MEENYIKVRRAYAMANACILDWEKVFTNILHKLWGAYEFW